MPTLFDPIRALEECMATPHVEVDASGAQRIVLRYARGARSAEQRRAVMIVRRYEALLLMQVDVPPGHAPRTVQQLVAAGRIIVSGGRYKLCSK